MHHHCIQSSLCVVVLLLVQYPIQSWSWRWDPESNDHPCTIKRWTWGQIIAKFGPNGLPPLYPEPVVIVLQHNDDRRNKNNYQNLSLSHSSLMMESLPFSLSQSSSQSLQRTLTSPPQTLALQEEEQLDFFRYLTEHDNLMNFLGPTFPVTISSSNSLSENKQIITLQEYFSEMDQQDTLPDQLANETRYLFGETYSHGWRRLLQHYPLPLCHTCTTDLVTLSFGIGNRGSGVQWHTHGPGFSQTIHGRKHWILYKPQHVPHFNKDKSSRHWMETVYWESDPKPYECTLNETDWLYFPDRWWHATINLDPYTVFVSTFTTEHGIEFQLDDIQ